MKKTQLRMLYKSVRNSICENEKLEFDKRIFTQLINSQIYKDANLLLIYVSFGGEIDTVNIINHALNSGKNVAVPYCKDNEMLFYIINSSDELIKGRFGIPTVIPDNSRLVTDYGNAVCVIPALSFDGYGNRLGYGGGFYDRFLSDKDITAVGLCFERCIHSALPSEEHDIKVGYILTENRLKKL